VQNITNVTQTTSTTPTAQASEFSVPWMTRVIKRDENGKVVDVLLTLTATKFQIDVTPTPLFGQNIAKFGFDVAEAMMEDEPTPEDHDFGVCTPVPGTLRQLKTGEWAIDLSVPKHNRRRPDAYFDRELLDDDGQVIGTEEIVKPLTERWVTVMLGMITPLPEHPRSRTFNVRDDEYLNDLRVNDKSASYEEGRQSKAKGPRAKSTRISPAAVRAMLAKKKKSGV
jgi:hypothetical protein